MKTKAIILVIVTLIIGFIIGMLTSAQLRHKRMRPVRMMYSERYFKENMLKVIQPDEKQLEEINMIIELFGEKNKAYQAEIRQNVKKLSDDMWKELKKVLSKEQLSKLEQIEKERIEAWEKFRSDTTNHRRREGMKGDRRDHRGPPPGYPYDSTGLEIPEGSSPEQAGRELPGEFPGN